MQKVSRQENKQREEVETLAEELYDIFIKESKNGWMKHHTFAKLTARFKEVDDKIKQEVMNRFRYFIHVR